MPKYEYVCKSCGEHLEVVQSFTDDALTVCPVCGGPLRKVYGNIGITFKGSGFYRTDNASKSRSEAGSEPAKADAGGDKDKGASSEKPAPAAAASDSKPSSEGKGRPEAKTA
jgi:putative FmdB family regulatory protein